MKDTVIKAAVLSSVSVLAFLPAAHAADWVVGAGYSDFSAGRGQDAVSFTLEVHGAPRWVFGRSEIGFGAAVMGDEEGDAWVGVGITALADLTDRWFVEASVMPGFYDEGTRRNDLGHDVEFRSLIGLGYTLNAATKLSVAFDHRSNASLGHDNPGVNTFGLRVRRTF